MATIKSSLVLNDRMTNVLNRINVAMTTVIDSCEAVSVATGQAVDVHQWDAARVAIGEASAAIQEMEANYGEAASGQDRLNQKISTGTAVAGGLLGKITGLVSAYGILRGVEKVLDSSDGMMQTTARLNLMNDGLQSTGDLLNMVYSSAQNARGSLSGMAAVVTRIGNNVGIGEGKIFGSSAEVIAFSELVQKQMTIAGASATEAENAILQLSQGLASGALRGDELRSVAEQAPGIIQNIADYLGVTTGEIREMASEGLITADVVKNAMFDAADDINTKFETMPMTWDQVCQSMTNNAQMQFIKPVSEKVKDIIATDEFQQILYDLQAVFVPLANMTIELLDGISNAAFFVSENFGLIAPVVGGLVGILGTYAVALGVVKAAEIASNVVKTASIVLDYARAFAKRRVVSATTAETAAQLGLNTAILTSPIFWIPIIIIGIVSAIYLVIGAINAVTGKTISATGFICGLLNVAWAVIYNLFAGAINWIIGAGINLYNAFVNFANGIAMVFINPIDAAKQLFYGLLDYVLGVMQTIAGAIDTVFGSNLAGAVAGWRSNLAVKAETAITTELANPLKTVDATQYMIERKVYTDSWTSGYNFGDDIATGIEDKLSGLFNNQSELVGNDISSIAGDTGSIANSLDKTNEELEWIRDIAEREVINRFTTAEVKVDFTGMTNQISNDMDLDGVISGFVGKFKESLQTAAQGVY